MKRLFLIGIAVLCTSFYMGCSIADESSTAENPNKTAAKVMRSHYYPMTCELPDGDCGSKCGISQQELCLEGSECEKNPEILDRYLKQKYSDIELKEMARNNASISDPYVISVLKEEGILPIK